MLGVLSQLPASPRHGVVRILHSTGEFRSRHWQMADDAAATVQPGQCAAPAAAVCHISLLKNIEICVVSCLGSGTAFAAFGFARNQTRIGSTIMMRRSFFGPWQDTLARLLLVGRSETLRFTSCRQQSQYELLLREDGEPRKEDRNAIETWNV